MVGGVGGPSGTHRAQIDPRGMELDEITPVKPKVTVPREGSVSPRQLSIPGRFPSPPPTFEKSAKLKAKLNEYHSGPQKLSTERLKQRMRLEGQLLAERQEYAELTGVPEDAFISYAHISGELGIGPSIADEVDQAHKTMSEKLDELMSSSAPDHKKMEGTTHLLKSMLKSQSDFFAAHAAQYEEVRSQPLSKEDHAHILRSELSLAAYAINTACDIPETIAKIQNKATSISEALVEAGHPEEAQHWTGISDCLGKVQTEIGGELQTAVDQAKLPALIQKYQETSSSWSNKALAFLGQGLRQGILSGIALGAVRAFTLAGLKNHPAAQALVAGLATAIAHEVGTHLAAAMVLDILGGATRPINSAEVLPAPNKFVSKNGEVRERSDEEMEAAVKKNDALRHTHGLSHNANKPSVSLSGDLKGFLMFATVQAIRAAASNDKELGKFTDAAYVTLGSIIAGIFMGGTHGADSLNAKMKDGSNRGLPAHTTVPKSTEKYAKRINDIVDTAKKKFDLTNPANVKTLQNKTAGLATGILSGKALEPAITAALERGGKSGAAIAGFSAAAQSILLLSQAWGAFGMSAQVAADKKVLDGARASRALEEGREPAPARAQLMPRTSTALKNVTDSGRPQFTHATEPNDGLSLAHNLSRLYTAYQGVSELPGAVVNDVTTLMGNAAIDKGKKVFGSNTNNPTTAPASGAPAPASGAPVPASVAPAPAPVAAAPARGTPATARGASAGDQGGQSKK
jgi:hypothetical protein